MISIKPSINWRDGARPRAALAITTSSYLWSRRARRVRDAASHVKEIAARVLKLQARRARIRTFTVDSGKIRTRWKRATTDVRHSRRAKTLRAQQTPTNSGARRLLRRRSRPCEGYFGPTRRA